MANNLNRGEISATINGVVRTFIQNDYEKLSNLPSINGKTIMGDLKLEDLGFSEIIFDYSNQLPSIGNSKCLYIATEENKIYIWNENSQKYHIIGSDYNEISVINGGGATDA